MVIVDAAIYKFGRMLMCHMVADTHEELLQMATALGVDHKWIQNPGTPREHFDICKSKRKKAISLGAVKVSAREMGRRLREKREAGKCDSCPFKRTNWKEFGQVAKALCEKHGQPEPDFWGVESIRKSVIADAIENRQLACHKSVYDSSMNVDLSKATPCIGLAEYLQRRAEQA